MDVFPTIYAFNSVGKIRRILEKKGFDAAVYGYESEPAYSAFSKVLFGVLVLVHAITPPMFRTGIFVFARKR